MSLQSTGVLNEACLLQATDACKSGGVIAYPTEAVYGLGCLPMHRQAVMRILKLKWRPVRKGLILVAADICQILPYTDFSRVPDRQIIEDSWPGPYTWLIPAGKHTPKWLTGRHSTLAVRVSADPTVRVLCGRLGALVSTSANPANGMPARSDEAVRNFFSDRIDYIIPGEVKGVAKPTQIKDALSGRVIRVA